MPLASAQHLTIAALLRRMETVFPAVGVSDRRRRTTYGDLARRSRGLAAGLLAAGIRPGDRIATLLWNQLDHLEAYFGIPFAAAVVHPLNLRLHPSELAVIVRHAADRWVLVDESLLPLWRRIGIELERVIVVPSDDYEALLSHPADAAAPDAAFEPAIDELMPAGMCYTSGTTAQPKGVEYSHRAIVLHALATSLPDCMNLRQQDCVLPLVPMFHANAWGIPYAAALSGCRQVLPGSQIDAVSILDLMAAEQVTFSAAVPVVWDGILTELERLPGRWPLNRALRVNLGGAPAPELLFQRFDRQGIEVNMGWGMTEMTPVGAMNPLRSPADPLTARSRQGRALPLVELRIRNDSGRALPWDGHSAGELEVRGPWVATGYVGEGAPRDAFTADGWFRTGDVVNISADGLIRIVDRNKDLIRSGGEWISSVALESALSAHPSIKDVAVIALPDPKWQERPLAIVVLIDGAPLDPAALRQFLSGTFARWELPDRFLAVAELPRTSTGKLDKKLLRSRYGGDGWPTATENSGS